jgi:hypothetical protein
MRPERRIHMSVNVRIISIRDFLQVAPLGSQDFRSLKQALAEAASVQGAFLDYDLLIDTRGADIHLLLTDIWELAADLARIIHAGASKSFRAKIPVLCPAEGFDHAKFFSLCAENRGLNVRAFTSYEDVFAWLSGSSTPSR